MGHCLFHAGFCIVCASLHFLVLVFFFLTKGLLLMNLSPRPSATKLAAADLRGFEARRLQTLQGQTRLTQESIQVASGIIQSAMQSGQGHARVQTIFLSQAQFTLTSNVSTDTFQVHDCYMLTPIKSLEKRVCFTSCVRDFVNWIREQGLHFLCTSLSNGTNPTFLHIEAYFIPEQPVPAGARALSLWNTVYTQKCVDASAIPAWNQKCAHAIRRGGSHFIVCTLYKHSDFFPISDTTTLQGIVVPSAPRHHLSMAVLSAQEESLVLNPKFDIMVEWVRELGYNWTLTMASSSVEVEWAYFVVLLDPINV
jgi:hypothetical protein